MAIRQIPYKPRHAGLHERIESRRFFVLVAHRRFGKTVIAINHLIKQALMCARPQGHFAYVAPLRTQAKSVAWDYLKRYTQVVAGRAIHETELSVTVPSPGGVAKVRLFGADNPDSLRGMYYDAVVLDEVAQMKPYAWEEIIQPALTDRQGSALFIGTPKGANLFSRLYQFAVSEAAAGSTVWGAAAYPVTETCVLQPEEVARLRGELSEGTFRQEMLCDFTATCDDRLIALDLVNRAIAQEPDARQVKLWHTIIGVDVARFGDDATVFFPRQGPEAREPLILRKLDTVDVAVKLAEFVAEHNADLVCVDQGQGAGVIDLARQLVCAPVIEVPFGSQAADAKRYVNRRAEMWCLMRDWLRGEVSLPRKQAQALRAELPAPGYNYDVQGRIKLEPKEEIKQRLGHSPDLGDALALTFASPMALIPKEQGPQRKYFYDDKGVIHSRFMPSYVRGAGEGSKYDPYRA